MAIVKLSDEDLWEIIGWQSASLSENRWSGSYADPYAKAAKAVSRKWIDWAKGEIQSMGQWNRLFGSDALAAYLCRLMCIRELVRKEDGVQRNNVTKEHLRAALMSGLAASGIDIQHVWPQHLDTASSIAQQRGLIITEEVDEWRPGMASGTEWRTYIRLTVAGRLLATKNSATMPEMYRSEVPGNLCDQEPRRADAEATSSSTEPSSQMDNVDLRSDQQSERAQRQKAEIETPLNDCEAGEKAGDDSGSRMQGIIGVDRENRLILNPDALAQHVAAALKRTVEKSPAKRTARATAIDAIKAALKDHLRAARDHAYDSKRRRGEPELLPRPTQKQLAEQLGLSRSAVSRAINDKYEKELPILWENLLDLEFVMRRR